MIEHMQHSLDHQTLHICSKASILKEDITQAMPVLSFVQVNSASKALSTCLSIYNLLNIQQTLASATPLLVVLQVLATGWNHKAILWQDQEEDTVSEYRMFSGHR